MNGETPGLVGRLNQATQSVIALSLTAGLIYGFILGKVSDDSYTNIAFAAISFIYGARTATAAIREKSMSDANTAATTAATTAAATAAAITGTGAGTPPPPAESKPPKGDSIP